MHLYFTSNQVSTMTELGTIENAFKMIAKWGNRLRKAMGEDVLSRNFMIGGEFRVPTFRSMAESLDRNVWEVYRDDGRSYYVVPYNNIYDGWKEAPECHRAGFMCNCVNSYEYAYGLWNERTHEYHPNLLDNATFGAWAELLPEPYSLMIDGNTAVLSWAEHEPRVHRYKEMGRYLLNKTQRIVEVTGSSWRVARAEAYVQAWEKMVSNEPEDHYKSVMLAKHEESIKNWGK